MSLFLTISYRHRQCPVSRGAYALDTSRPDQTCYMAIRVMGRDTIVPRGFAFESVGRTDREGDAPDGRRVARSRPFHWAACPSRPSCPRCRAASRGDSPPFRLTIPPAAAATREALHGPWACHGRTTLHVERMPGIDGLAPRHGGFAGFARNSRRSITTGYPFQPENYDLAGSLPCWSGKFKRRSSPSAGVGHPAKSGLPAADRSRAHGSPKCVSSTRYPGH
jgi:hypothetical protein